MMLCESLCISVCPCLGSAFIRCSERDLRGTESFHLYAIHVGEVGVLDLKYVSYGKSRRCEVLSSYMFACDFYPKRLRTDLRGQGNECCSRTQLAGAEICINIQSLA